MLEDKLVLVKSMISKNIGKSHTDLLRLFENIKEELMNLYEQSSEMSSSRAEENGNAAFEKLSQEMHGLQKEIKTLEATLDSKDQEMTILNKKSQADQVELKTLRKACQLQKDDLFNMELKLQRALEDASNAKFDSEFSKSESSKEFDKKLAEKEAIFEKETKAMRDQLTEVMGNEGTEDLFTTLLTQPRVTRTFIIFQPIY